MSEGLRIKARVPAELWGEVKACADWARCSVEDWTFAVCRDFKAGKLGVPNGFNVELGTREGSVTPWVRVPRGFDTAAQNLRAALRAGVEHVRPRMWKPGRVEFHGFVIEGSGSEVSVRAKANEGTKVTQGTKGKTR